jgi:hypothetical protein
MPMNSALKVCGGGGGVGGGVGESFRNVKLLGLVHFSNN